MAALDDVNRRTRMPTDTAPEDARIWREESTEVRRRMFVRL
ncbi:hypothetical protein ABZ626_38330 [Streptomyces longispororuber]